MIKRFRRVAALAMLTAVAVAAGACTPNSQPAPSTSAPARPTAQPAAKPTTGTTSANTPAAAGVPSVSIRGPFEDEAKTLNGAGATFPAALYSKWFNEYEKLTHVRINYQSIGSGGGIKSIQDQTVDFGASDSPMSDEQLQTARGGEILHIPTALGAVVPTYNLPGLKSDTKLKFTGETLAGIFQGEITKWNDPKLVADNPELQGVNTDIVVVHRSDGSGTTSIWVDYLSTVSRSWEQSVGRGTSVNWPVGLGGKGNEGVAGEVKQTPNSIGYVELIYALQNGLGIGQVKNRAGEFVEPSLESVTAAAAGAAGNIKADLRATIVDAPGNGAYPISGFTWILAYKTMDDKPKAVALTRMLWWATHDAQQFNAELGYAPVPQEIVARGEGLIQQISSGGQPAFPGR
jgi:phosphate transport system substrate-binding protein